VFASDRVIDRRLMAGLGVIEDKLALVTGASSGIGHELAKEGAHRGYDVVASGGER
jgi:NADP-dependent 3-hydroxy acid dehydrogenase YdfG